MALRIVLNPDNAKEVVATCDPEWKLELRKGGVALDELSEAELLDLYEQRHLAEYADEHLNGREVEDRPALVRLLNHLLHFIHLRDKPFLLLERDSVFEEQDGVPQFRHTYIGQTAWTTLRKHGVALVEHFAGPIGEIEWC